MVDESMYSQLDSYFNRRMSEEERNGFEKMLSGDSVLREELVWMQSLQMAMSDSGKTVLRGHIAAALSGIPPSEIQKYMPAKNAPSFWKKWWWAIAGAVVTLAVAATVYSYMNRHAEGEMEGDSKSDQVPAIDSVQPGAAPMDSLCDSSSVQPVPPGELQKSDTANSALFEKVDSVYYPDNIPQNVSGNDASNFNTFTASSTIAPAAGTRSEPLKARINPRTSPPYTYVLDQNLTLNANYTTTSGFVFKGAGDTVYMTDASGLQFMLLRNKGAQPLQPYRAAK